MYTNQARQGCAMDRMKKEEKTKNDKRMKKEKKPCAVPGIRIGTLKSLFVVLGFAG